MNTDSFPWREFFPEFEHETSYSIALRGVRKRERLTQKQLAELSEIPQGHISRMENGKMTIGKECARQLAKVLKADYRMFL